MAYYGKLEISMMPDCPQKSILLYMRNNKITSKEVQRNIDISYHHLIKCLHLEHPLTEKVRQKINEFLNTNF